MRTLHRRRYANRLYLSVMGQEPTPDGGITVPPVTPDTPAPVDPAAPADPATPPTPATPDEPKVFDEAYVRGLRTENANHRIKNKELADALEAYQRKERSDLENLSNDVTKYKGDIDGLRRENQKLMVQIEAAKLGIVDPEAASLLLDWTAIEGGAPVAEALANLITARPWLKQAQAPATTPPATPPAPQTPPPPANPAAPATPPHEGKRRFTKSELDKMTQAEMSANLDDVLYAYEHGLVDTSR